MRFNADEIASVIQKEIEQYESELDVREVGTVLDVGDGIAHVYGLSNVMAGEMVAFPNGVNGLAFNLEENSVGIIILGVGPMIAGPFLGLLGNVFGEAGVVTNFAGMWFTLAAIALFTAALVAFAFRDETQADSQQ